MSGPTRNNPARHTERTTIVSVPLPTTLAQRLRDRARDNDRHLAGELRRIVRQALGEDDADSVTACEAR